MRVVKAGGLAAAGRQIGLSPASMTARMNALENHYKTRLLHRTTRRISLTDSGQRFYDACLRILAEVEQLEALLHNERKVLSGRLRITAPSDFGRQYVAPALSEFTQLHPAVIPSLHLSDGVVNLVEFGFDLGIRYGNLPDSNLITRSLADNHRVLVASPGYVETYGPPNSPDDLKQHRCLVMEHFGELLNEWRFYSGNGNQAVRVDPAFVSNDGAIIRQWALAGKGIAYKSIWDVQRDLDAGLLLTLLDKYVRGFQASDTEKTGLQLVYPGRRYQPVQVAGFIEFFKNKILEIEAKK